MLKVKPDHMLIMGQFKQRGRAYLVKVLHLVPIGEPGLLVLARLDDKHLVVGEHLREAVGKHLSHLDVDLVHQQLFLVALHSGVLVTAGVLPHVHLVHHKNDNTHHEDLVTAGVLPHIQLVHNNDTSSHCS